MRGAERHRHGYAVDGRLAPAVQQQFHRRAAQPVVGQADAGQPGTQPARQVRVVERHDTHVVRHAQPRLLERLVGAQGEPVVEADQLFRRVHVPLARPAISSLTILLFLWTWNQFLLCIVLVDDPTRRTMAGALGAFQGQWGTDLVLLCAGSLLILTPTLVVFLIFQRQFVSALLQGSVKG